MRVSAGGRDGFPLGIHLRVLQPASPRVRLGCTARLVCAVCVFRVWRGGRPAGVRWRLLPASRLVCCRVCSLLRSCAGCVFRCASGTERWSLSGVVVRCAAPRALLRVGVCVWGVAASARFHRASVSRSLPRFARCVSVSRRSRGARVVSTLVFAFPLVGFCVAVSAPPASFARPRVCTGC